VNEAPDNRLAELMDAQKVSARDLAVELGVTEATVVRLRRPVSAIPTKYLSTLTIRFGVSADHLLGMDREEAKT
jgi:DNA-binding Xre family transcriptional regulator